MSPTAQAFQHARRRFAPQAIPTPTPAIPTTLADCLIELVAAHLARQWARLCTLQLQLESLGLSARFTAPTPHRRNCNRLAIARPILIAIAAAIEAEQHGRVTALRDELIELGIFVGTMAEANAFSRTIEDNKAAAALAGHAHDRSQAPNRAA